MKNEALIAELKTLLEDYLVKHGVDLVELIYRFEGKDLMLRILIDRPRGGISLDECAHLNTQIRSMLDEMAIMPDRYVLEVSSPGLDRPLKAQKDFLRCAGRKARFFLTEKIQEKIELEGIIKEVKEDAVVVETGDGTIAVPFAKINKAKQAIE